MLKKEAAGGFNVMDGSVANFVFSFGPRSCYLVNCASLPSEFLIFISVFEPDPDAYWIFLAMVGLIMFYILPQHNSFEATGQHRTLFVTISFGFIKNCVYRRLKKCVHTLFNSIIILSSSLKL